jgi:hypothetical protein
LADEATLGARTSKRKIPGARRFFVRILYIMNKLAYNFNDTVNTSRKIKVFMESPKVTGTIIGIYSIRGDIQ